MEEDHTIVAETLFPARKANRLSNYNYSQSGYYFVTICVKGKKKLLGDVVDGDAFTPPKMRLTRTGKTVEKYLATIPGADKYCIMPNHIHLIVSIQSSQSGSMWASTPTDEHCSPKQTLPKIIRSFKILVTKELGYSIFQRSYYDHVIRSDKDYMRIWDYIENNPANWRSDRFFVPHDLE